MKKYLFLLSCFLLIGCKPICTLSQVHDMAVYADSSCTAMLPDYFKIFIPSDNCKIFSQYQDPPAGFPLSVDNPIVNVKLTILDYGTNTRSINFNSYYLDTIKPFFKLKQDSVLSSKYWITIDKLYNQADKMLFSMLKEDYILPINTTFLSYIPHQYGSSYASGISRKVYPVLNSSVSMGKTTWNWDGVLQVDTSVFYNKNLIIRKGFDNKRSFSFE